MGDPELSEPVVELTEEEKAQLVGEVPDRRVVVTGAVLLVICAAFVGRGMCGDGGAGDGASGGRAQPRASSGRLE